VLAVHEDMIKNNRGAVQTLVDGIAQSGKWIDQSMTNRMDAAQFVAKSYYNQDPRLLSFVLSKPPDRVKYTNLALRKKDFQEIEELGKQAGILQGTARFEDYTDASFVPDDSVVKPYAWEGLKK
jgi:NitT/TauT family transport system substrate-binding protein